MWLGTAILAELPDRAAAEALLAPDAARYDTIEVHPWSPAAGADRHVGAPAR